MYEPDKRTLEQIQEAFTYHPPSADQIPRYEEIRQQGRIMAAYLVMVCPPSRELSLALTNIEQAVFWANAAIARHEKAPDGGPS